MGVKFPEQNRYVKLEWTPYLLTVRGESKIKMNYRMELLTKTEKNLSNFFLKIINLLTLM